MPDVLEIPSRQNAALVKVPIDVSTSIDGEKVEDTFEAELPRNLESAIALEGIKDVFRRYINAYVVYLQGKRRQELVAARSTGSDKERKRAKYLEELGL